MKQRILTQAIIILALFTTISLQGQVTIGSNQPPVSGALLDLTEGNTTKKGLGLPRVELKSLTITSGTNLATTIDGAAITPAWDKDEHIGLLIYNTPDDPTCPTIESGLYVWDGEQWQPLQGKSLIDQTSFVDNGDGTGALTDYEGNRYGAKEWGGVFWTTENARSLRDYEGKFIDCTDGLRINPAHFGNAVLGITVKNEIPAGTVSYTNAGTVITNQSYEDFVAEFGLLYTQPQAMKTCPRGWHIPSMAEWQNLGASMGGMSTAGYKMVKHPNTNYTSADGTTNNITDGNVVTPNGFNAVPTGYVNPIAHGGGAWFFGRETYWWSSNNAIGYYVCNWLPNLFDFHPGTGEIYFAVRCVKD